MIKLTLSIDRGFSAWPFYIIPSWVAGTLREDAYSAHEKLHCTRQRWQTPIWWLRYWLSKKFRWQEESLAYQVEIKIIFKTYGVVDKQYYITQLSTNYWNMISKKDAEVWINNLTKDF